MDTRYDTCNFFCFAEYYNSDNDRKIKIAKV